MLFCFRPLPGSHLYKLTGIFTNLIAQAVFVPFRGLIFINNVNYDTQFIPVGFRPLPGSHLYKFRKAETNHQAIVVFVPFRGLIFINIDTMFYVEQKISVFVPFRGLIFINWELPWQIVNDALFSSPSGVSSL